MMTARRLDIASGYSPHDPERFEHLDISPNAPHVEHVADAFGEMPFDDGTFSELRAVDVLEHAPYRRTSTVLAEWQRILAPGGSMFIQVPDVETIMQWYFNAPGRLAAPNNAPPEFEGMPRIVATAWRILGGQDDGVYSRDGDDPTWNLHKALFSMESLQWYLEQAGFQIENMGRNPFPNLQCRAIRI